ncbi:prolyl endopeptidase-like isoform X2 [Acanthaster planci]|uniref:Prolyl endopeptidase n=1 Tax=Acanthaster planci TaxID=133434 RepID=A0A8B7YXW5_ACAPL|nr:prolyl endopeptidase-like isoform X2 [Acanthaster planci]
MRASARYVHQWQQRNSQLMHHHGWERHTHHISRLISQRRHSSSEKESGSSDQPTAKRQAQENVHHGQRLVDHYSWMQQSGITPDVRSYVDQETRLMATLMQETQSFQSQILKQLEEFKNIYKTNEMPIVMNGTVYFRRSDGDSWQYYRRRSSVKSNGGAAAEHILDTAMLTEMYGHPVALATMKISPDQKYMAFVVETTAADTYDAHIIDMGKDGVVFVDRLNHILSVEFAHHGVMYYTRMKGLRAAQVWRHQIGQNVSKDKMVVEELDERFFLDLSHTKDRLYVTVNHNSATTSEVRLLDSRHPDPSLPAPVVPRQAGVQYFVEHSQGVLYILTNAGDEEYRLVAVPVSDDGCLKSLRWADCCTVFTPMSSWHILDMDVFTDHCVLCAAEGTVPRIVVIPLDSWKQPNSVKVPENFCWLTSGPNATCTATDFQFSLSSPVQPATNCHLAIGNKRHPKVVLGTGRDGKVKEDSGVFIKGSPKEKVCTRLEAVSKDGTHVPVTVFHRHDIRFSSDNPMLVCSYGAYGVSLDMSYDPHTALLVELGWVVAYCHVRGGSDLGVQWHHSGRALNKIKGIEDLEACIATLQLAGYSQPTITALRGVSAGGLVVAALCNRAPQLIKAAVLEVRYQCL